MSPAASTARPSGRFKQRGSSGPAVAGVPAGPDGLPATVDMSPAVMAWPHWVPLAAVTSWIRLLPVSAMYRSPAAVDDRRRWVYR